MNKVIAAKHTNEDVLLKKILWKIREEKNKRIRKEVLLSFCGLMVSLALLPLSFQLSYSNFIETGFIYYLGTIIMHWELWSSFLNEFIFILLESLPTVGLLLVLTNLFMLAFSLKYLLKNSSHFSFKFLFSRLI
ncbi:MAG: hypothetical protein WC579_00235 [Candidatus Paceibacterota bacterium]|jgi:hypothetical protein|nr:hypothetical protein [Candidatus Paceibacterota bacterium]HQM34992.1 hypothetical protein [Candidatus Paceibacterota bacterium]